MKKLSIPLFLFLISSHSIAGVGDLYNCKMTKNVVIQHNLISKRDLENFSFEMTETKIIFNPSNYIKDKDAYGNNKILELEIIETSQTETDDGFELFWANDGYSQTLFYINRALDKDSLGEFSYSEVYGDAVLGITAQCEIF